MSSLMAAMLTVCRRVSMPSCISSSSICSIARPYSSVKSGDNQINEMAKPARKDRYSMGLREFKSPTVYKTNPTPTRMGWKQTHFDGGPLPRIDEPIRSLPEYKPKDGWSKTKALYGQNDYIDILGDGGIKPYETHKGPKWLIGFYGPEYARTLRRLKFTGKKLAALKPRLSNDLNKRLRYLYKLKNTRRKRGTLPKYI